MHRSPTHSRPAMYSARHDGFTLIEVLVSITIFVLIAAAVYASFSSVTVATDDARIGAEEMRLRQFLSRNLLNNLATVVDAYIAGPPNAQDMMQDMQAAMNPELAFVGVSERGSDGARDTLEFASSSPLLGGISPPGSLKRVRYEVTEDSESNLLTAEEERRAEEAGTQLRLTVRETRLQGGAWMGDTDLKSDTTDLFETDSPSWSVPVSSFDVAFFDGKDWVEEWDSAATLMMPWCLRIRINYARSEDEKRADSQAGLDAAKDPDYEVIVPLPVGAGTVIPTGEWMYTVFPEAVPGEGGGGGTNKGENDKNTGKNTS